MQLDFGEDTFKSGLKVYIFGALLSASRFKYVIFQKEPFTTLTVIEHLLNCFDYFGGIPHELVIDQDKVMVHLENYGDILYTKKFKQFIEEMNLKMYVCRKADPESKGKVENLIKFIKYNFMDSRNYSDVKTLNKDITKWLKRRANGKISQATNKIPSIMIEEERKYLREIKSSIFRKNKALYHEERMVVDGFISVKSNQYSIPDLYSKKKVTIFMTETDLFIFDFETNNELTQHQLSLKIGEKIINRSHFRQHQLKIEEIRVRVKSLYPENKDWNLFLSQVTKKYPRYIRDQFLLIERYFSKNIDKDILQIALKFCMDNNTISGKNLQDTYETFLREQEENIADVNNQKEKVHPPNLHLSKKNNDNKIDVAQRDLSQYREILQEASV